MHNYFDRRVLQSGGWLDVILFPTKNTIGESHIIISSLAHHKYHSCSLKLMEKTLGTVQEMRGNCLQELEDQLKKQREIAAMTSTNVKNVIVGNLFEIAMNCDDGDMELSDTEVDHLMEKIEHIAGVDVREAKVRQLIADQGRNLMCKCVWFDKKFCLLISLTADSNHFLFVCSFP